MTVGDQFLRILCYGFGDEVGSGRAFDVVASCLTRGSSDAAFGFQSSAATVLLQWVTTHQVRQRKQRYPQRLQQRRPLLPPVVVPHRLQLLLLLVPLPLRLRLLVSTLINVCVHLLIFSLTPSSYKACSQHIYWTELAHNLRYYSFTIWGKPK